MSLRLVQRLPDQTRAFFTARGFSVKDAEQIAQACVFQSIFKNTAKPDSGHVIEYNLSAWQVRYKGKAQVPMLKKYWMQEWEKRQVPRPARIAFEWSLLPTEQRYEPQDYNWGMTLYDLPPGAEFNLEVVWWLDGELQSAKIEKIRCAEDKSVGPATPMGQ
jgi:hypothetical protein